MIRTLLVAAAWFVIVPGLGSLSQASDPLAARAKGRPDAPVTVYEMSDFQCPYCREFALGTMPLLEREYVEAGKVRFAYITLPPSSLPKNPPSPPGIPVCAPPQHRCWPMPCPLCRPPAHRAAPPRPR